MTRPEGDMVSAGDGAPFLTSLLSIESHVSRLTPTPPPCRDPSHRHEPHTAHTCGGMDGTAWGMVEPVHAATPLVYILPLR